MSSNQESGRCFLALYSDSFTEALRDHRSGRIVAGTGRPEQVIGKNSIETYCKQYTSIDRICRLSHTK